MDNDSDSPDTAKSEAAKNPSELTPEEFARYLKRKYEEYSRAADELDKQMEAEKAAFEEQFTANDGRFWTGHWGFNTKRELAEEYYEQWQIQLKKMGKSDAEIDTPESSTDEE